MTLNPAEAVNLFFDEAAELVHLKDEFYDVLKSSYREIDVQVPVRMDNGELAVFRGGIQTLRRTRPVIVFECGLGGADWFGAEPEQIYDCLTSAIGLRVSLLDRWLSGGEALTPEQFASQYRDRLNFYFVAHP